MICRREFITLLGGAAAWPVTVQAQQAAMPVIGLLHSGSPDLSLAAQGLAAFRRGLSENGFAEGRNVSIQYRWAEDHNERFPQLAAELVQRGVSGFVEGVEPGREGDALYVTIRSAKVTPSMGGGRMVEEVDEGESLRFLARWVRETFKVQPDDLRIMRVEGDSMEPTLLDQDTVIVELAPTPCGFALCRTTRVMRPTT